MIALVFGRRARFCDVACRDGFRSDRVHRLIYPSYDVDGQIMSVEEASLVTECCAYCAAPVSREVAP